MASLNVSCLLIDPTDPNTIYAGTGEGFYSIDAYRGRDLQEAYRRRAHLGPAPLDHRPAVPVCQPPGDGEGRLGPAGGRPRAATARRMGISRAPRPRAEIFSAVTSIEGNEILDVDIPDGAAACVAGGRNGKAFYSADAGASWTAAAGLPTVAGLFEGRVGGCRTHRRRRASSTPRSTTTRARSTARPTRGRITPCGTPAPTTSANRDGTPTRSGPATRRTRRFVVVGGLDLYRSPDGAPHFTQISTWDKKPASAPRRPARHRRPRRLRRREQPRRPLRHDGGIYASTDIRASDRLRRAGRCL